MPSEIKQGVRYTYKDNLVIAKPVNLKPIPAFCPVCKCYMSSSEDARSFRKFECCQSCELTWAEANSGKWCEEGWRPTSLEIQEEKKKRINQLRNLSVNH